MSWDPQPSPAPRPLNIAIVSDGIGDVVAGSFISTERFGKLLSVRGHRIVFISSATRRHPGNHEYLGIPTYRLPSIPVPWSEGQLYLAIPIVRRLRTILRSERIDVVHVMIPMPLGLVTARLAKTLGLPVVMHSHTQPENIFMNSPKFPGRDRLQGRFSAYLNWIYRQGDVVIYPSAFSRRQFPELESVKSVVISNGVDTQRFRPTSPDAIMQRYGLSRAQEHLLYVGRLHREKDVETLIAAMPPLLQRRGRAHLVIAGFGYEQPALETLVDKLELTQHVTFCGFVPNDDLAALYNAAALFVLPSVAELESMAVLEAMACARPLLVANSPTSAATDFVDGNGLLFRPGDSGHLAEQACRLLSDAEGLRAMGARSLATSRRFDIHASAAAIESVYDSLAARP
jgi:glycosyltransferase involved in cell wall biosynthesis